MKNLILISLLISLPLEAEERLQISGFGTIGTVSVDSDYYGYRTDLAREDGTFDDDLNLSTSSILGIQFDYLVNSDLNIVYQAVHRNQNDVTLDSLTTLAFLKYSPSAAWTYRLGRTALDLFLLTEYRDVGFASTWAHAPTETYGLVPYRFLDGGDISYTARYNKLALRSKFFLGQSASDVAGYKSHGNVKLDNIYGIGFEVESISWSMKSKYTSAKIYDNIATSSNLSNGLLSLNQFVPGFDLIWPNAQQFSESLLLDNARAQYLSFSGRYDFEQWSFLAEASIIRSDNKIISDVDSGYVSANYRINAHNFYTVYATARSQFFDINSLNVDLNSLAMIPGGLEIYDGSHTLMNAFTPNQNTLSFGWRWNMTDSTAFNIQLDRTAIKAHGSSLWLNKDQLNQPAETVNAIFVNLNFTF